MHTGTSSTQMSVHSMNNMEHVVPDERLGMAALMATIAGT